MATTSRLKGARWAVPDKDMDHYQYPVLLFSGSKLGLGRGYFKPFPYECVRTGDQTRTFRLWRSTMGECLEKAFTKPQPVVSDHQIQNGG